MSMSNSLLVLSTVDTYIECVCVCVCVCVHVSQSERFTTHTTMASTHTPVKPVYERQPPGQSAHIQCRGSGYYMHVFTIYTCLPVQLANG